MPFTIDQIRETPAGPRIEAVPSSTYGKIEIANVPALGGVQLQKGTNVFPPGYQWNLTPRSILSFGIKPSRAAGGSLQIDISSNGTNYEPLLSFHLIGLIYNFVSGIELPGFSCWFTILNADPVNVQNFDGSIILKGV